MIVNRFVLGGAGMALSTILTIFLMMVDGSRIIMFVAVIVLLVSAMIALPFVGVSKEFTI